MDFVVVAVPYSFISSRPTYDIKQQSEKKTEAGTFRSEGESKYMRQGNVRDGVEVRGLGG